MNFMLPVQLRGVSVLANYRLYRLDGAGKISSAEWLEAADDDEAERQVRDGKPEGPVELWDRNRLVARIDLNSGQSGE
jgi:hypothetical protein